MLGKRVYLIATTLLSVTGCASLQTRPDLASIPPMPTEIVYETEAEATMRAQRGARYLYSKFGLVFPDARYDIAGPALKGWTPGSFREISIVVAPAFEPWFALSVRTRWEYDDSGSPVRSDTFATLRAVGLDSEGTPACSCLTWAPVPVADPVVLARLSERAKNAPLRLSDSPSVIPRPTHVVPLDGRSSVVSILTDTSLETFHRGADNEPDEVTALAATLLRDYAEAYPAVAPYLIALSNQLREE